MEQGNISRIAGTAVQLRDQLAGLGITPGTADEWVARAMPAIVTFEAARPPSGSSGEPGPPHEPRSRSELAGESFASRPGGPGHPVIETDEFTS